jgi:hypothetical protein
VGVFHRSFHKDSEPAVDVLNPWGDWPTWLGASQLVPTAERSEYLKPAFLASVAPLDPVTVFPKLTHLPVRLQQNMWDDTTTPANSRERIAAALPVNDRLAQYKDEQTISREWGTTGRCSIGCMPTFLRQHSRIPCQSRNRRPTGCGDDGARTATSAVTARNETIGSKTPA